MLKIHLCISIKHALMNERVVNDAPKAGKGCQIYTPIRFRAQTLSSAITGGFKYAKLHLIYSHTMIQAVHRQLYLFTLRKMLNSLLLCSRMAPSNGDLYVLQTESVYTQAILLPHCCIYMYYYYLYYYQHSGPHNPTLP